MVRFTELNPRAFEGAVVIVDIDGTITNDRNPAVELSAKHQLRAFATYAHVYLCSNGHDTGRFRELARDTGTTYLETLFKKPDIRILESIPNRAGKRLFVIGDKQLTDGRFAKKIGAVFIQTARITHSSDRATVMLTYALDDLYAFGMRALRSVAPYVELARPLQWVKNLLVFSPIFFANQAFDLKILGGGVLAYIVFSLAASAVYVMNDLVDVEHDRLHPRKRHRPIARGDVHETKAVAFIAVLLSAIIAALAFVPALLPIALLYIGLNALYSFKLKHIAVVDILLVSMFYVLRVVAGGVATGLPLTPWIILCVLFGALFIIIGKRRAEANRATHRAVLDTYSKDALDAMLNVTAGLSIISYGLYSILGHDSPYLVYSTIFVAFVFFRMLNHIYLRPHDAEAPEKLVFKDRWILGSFAAWVVYVFWVFYLVPIA
ncbi:MAG: decaprenyl-phosphate phosphoribosyltransferase [bacterium]|nr:decaprenyl-phosphate phosphoribosyltransferase [bacterium]